MEASNGLEPYPPHDTHGYSAAARRILGLTAVLITLLPIPIIYFKILPTYQRHASFLIFYTPFLCLLTLCYLFYVRDSLARTLFANVLDPPPPPDPFYREPMGQPVKRALRRIKSTLLGILPALLVLASTYCVSQYFRALDRSVTQSAQKYQERRIFSESTGAIPQDRSSTLRRRPPRSKGTVPADSSKFSTRDSVPVSRDSIAVRDYVLRTTPVDDIPGLPELTAYYVGAFIALLIAVTLMGLKEYAKEALGLSEHELMFGRYRRTEVEE